VKPPPDIVGVRPVDTSLAIDEAVEPAVLLDQAQIPFAQRARSDRSSASRHVLSSSSWDRLCES